MIRDVLAVLVTLSLHGLLGVHAEELEEDLVLLLMQALKFHFVVGFASRDWLVGIAVFVNLGKRVIARIDINIMVTIL